MSSQTELGVAERCAASLRRSRARRQQAMRRRRRRLRIRGGASVFVSAALTLASLGGAVAVGHDVRSGAPVAAQGLLAKGSSGPAVSAVQKALGLRANGVFSPRVDASVRRFQRRKGLLVDGIVGPQTRAALGLGSAAVATGGGGATAGGSAPSASLQRIANCESGGNPRAIGGGGRYRGKYQFSPETWRSVGGSGDPAVAPEAEQDRRAAALYARSGTASWPACG